MLLSVAFMVVVPLCATGRIKSNPIVGIRWASLRTSEVAWQTGHRAAMPATYVGGVLAILAGIGFEFVPNSGIAGPLVSFAFLLIGFGVASAAALRAVR